VISAVGAADVGYAAAPPSKIFFFGGGKLIKIWANLIRFGQI